MLPASPEGMLAAVHFTYTATKIEAVSNTCHSAPAGTRGSKTPSIRGGGGLKQLKESFGPMISECRLTF